VRTCWPGLRDPDPTDPNARRATADERPRRPNGSDPERSHRAVDRLSEAGLVSREACPEDRRGAFAALTDAGEARTRQALDVHRAQLARLLDGVLDPDEELALTAALRKLRDRVNPGPPSSLPRVQPRRHRQK